MKSIIVGITGGIGSGKTTVSNFLRDKGYLVYDSDKEARRLQNENPQVRQKTCGLLGDEAYIGTQMNREYVARQVFADKDKLQQLNDIVHPVVKENFLDWIEKNADRKILFQESAILFESGFYLLMDKIILVTAPEDVRIKRVMQRDNISYELVKSRISNQYKEERKGALSDFILRTDDDIPLGKKIDKILFELDKNG